MADPKQAAHATEAGRCDRIAIGSPPDPWVLQPVPSPARKKAVVDGGSCGAGLAERVEQHEVVDDAVVAHGRHRDARGAKLGGVGFSLIAKRVSLIDAQIGGRQPGELLDAGRPLASVTNPGRYPGLLPAIRR